MLIDFSVSNYRSIKDELTLSMMAIKSTVESNELVIELKKEKFKVLPLAVIYGPNASGKSNIIKAFKAFCSLIYSSDNKKIDEPIQHYKPFKLCNETIIQPTTYDCEFIIDDDRYRYKIEYNLIEILLEELYIYPEGREATLFKRSKNKKMIFGTYFKGPKKSIENALLPNTLFLSRGANQSSSEQLKKVYRYFRDNIKIHTTMDSNTSPFYETTEQIDENFPFRKRVLQFLNSADLNIDGIKIQNTEDAILDIHLPESMPDILKKKIFNSLSKKPLIKHNVYNKIGEVIDKVYFDLENEESGGTIKMYDLASKILNALDSGQTLIIDEFDSGLHPLLNQYILNLFQDPNINTKKSQLIVATHDICIMDLQNIRRDQIWFVDKNKMGVTELFSLSEFNKSQIRKGGNFSKWYLDGRFNAIPSLYNKFDIIIDGEDNA